MSQDIITDLAELMAHMRRREDAANLATRPEQRALIAATETVYWMRFVSTYNVSIFGESWSLREAIEKERKFYTLDEAGMPADPDGRLELMSISAGLRERRERGFLFGRCYSVLEPEGEIGDTHVSQVMPISRETFEEFRANGWRVDH